MKLNSEEKIFLAGHRGMVGSAILRQLQNRGFEKVIVQCREELDLANQQQVHEFLHATKPTWVIVAAAKVGGIYANNHLPAEFIYENLMIESNLIHQSYSAGVKSLLFLGSSCIYPKLAEQPMREDALLTGPLEPTNEPYAIAKIAGIKLCESYNRQYGLDYRSVMPTNLYGPGDNFEGKNSHVIPALIRKLHEAKLANAKEVKIWGTGKALREFLHVDDMAAACLHVMEQDSETFSKQVEPMLSHINVGSGSEVSIRNLAEMIAQTVRFEGDLHFDAEMSEGAARKFLDSRKLARLGWRSAIPLREGIAQTYQWFLENQSTYRGKSASG